MPSRGCNAAGRNSCGRAPDRGGKVGIAAATAACSTDGGDGGPSPDLLPPSTPLGFAATGSTQTTISVSWPKSTDNVGVAGYELYRNGALAGTTGALGYTFGGLTCGTSYTLAIDAIDAAGNRSGKASRSFSNGLCTSCSGAWVIAFAWG